MLYSTGSVDSCKCAIILSNLPADRSYTGNYAAEHNTHDATGDHTHDATGKAAEDDLH